jgi:hypothetical protein
MDTLDYLNPKTQVIEEFKGGMGAVSGGNFAGSGSFGGSRGSTSRSPSSVSQGGSRRYGSAGYASVNPITKSTNKSGSKSGSWVKPGAKTGTMTGGSFGGLGKYVIGFPGIKPGSNLPASSKPSMYTKPKITDPHPTISVKPLLVPEVTKPYGKIDTSITQGVPGPRIGNKYDNVNHRRATHIRGPKFPSGFDWRDKNLTGYYGYDGWGYYFDPFYWGYGPFWPYNGQVLNYPDIPYDYSDLMQKETDQDYIVNTVQNQIATQLMEEEAEQEKNNTKESSDTKPDDLDNPDNLNNPDKPNKENFESGFCKTNKEIVIIVLTVILILYLLLTIPLSSTEKSFSFFE